MDNAVGGSFSECTSSLHIKQKSGEKNKSIAAIHVTRELPRCLKLDGLSFTSGRKGLRSVDACEHALDVLGVDKAATNQ